MASSVTSAAASSRSVLLPAIPELFDPNFLDVLIPGKHEDVMKLDVDEISTVAPKNPMMEALKAVAHQTLTANGAPAYDSTLSPTLDAFSGLTRYTYGSRVGKLLDDAWKEDPGLTLRLIWSLRSIHDGKGEKEVFYRAFGWLYDNHPRTAISNLHMLVTPACSKKGKTAGAHGYWKDLLNILALATVGELSNINQPSTFLHATRTKYSYPRSKRRVKTGTPAERIEAAKAFNARAKEMAAVSRKTKVERDHGRLVKKLGEPKFRALFIAVARLFSDQLVKDIKVVGEIEALKPGENPISLLKKISLAGKWAPTPGGSHDRVTNIATAIAELIYASQSISHYPSSLENPMPEKERAVILRSFYQRWFLTELRRASCCPEPLMSANRWKEIKYNRVPSLCMKNCTTLFFKHDPEGFEGYLTSVESGKKKISGATLMPHEIVAQIIGKGTYDDDRKTPAGLKELKKRVAETQSRVAEAQWKTLIANLQESGVLENAIAVCDVSGSMGSIYYSTYTKRHPQPILPAISLSLVLAALAKPPFSGGFITFSAHPQFVALDTSQSLAKQIASMSSADWGMNTDLHAVFVKLLLPLAVKNKVKQEDMIKRLFIFSDMQFDACNSGRDAASWATNYDEIEKAYRAAGYEMPQIVYWDLAASASHTVEVEGDRKGVAMMNGFSPALLKVFMGENEEEEAAEWEKVGEDGESVTVVEKEDEFTPVNVMKKALMKRSFDGLVVVD
ncbi:unnamed protein product [Cyclocybe aegerita]|uniref:Uncharacterized protein n=1 Tax=Cyclocybe aegerita TaxID=1973307 RepID=A0A8S0XMF8_CYCAE|nr:unnamed protein product [Cyclocybe aegerita]